jgi:hypothetical protein
VVVVVVVPVAEQVAPVGPVVVVLVVHPAQQPQPLEQPTPAGEAVARDLSAQQTERLRPVARAS